MSDYVLDMRNWSPIAQEGRGNSPLNGDTAHEAGGSGMTPDIRSERSMRSERARRWRERHPLRARAMDATRRCHKRGGVGHLSERRLETMLVDARGHCPECRKHFGDPFKDRWVIWSAQDLDVGNSRLMCRECEMRLSKKMGVRFSTMGGVQ